MLKLYKGWRSISFLAPDDGGGSGGTSGQSTNGNGDADGGQSKAITTPFDDLPLDELDDASRAKFQSAKENYIATLQSSDKLKTDLQKQEELTRRFQGDADRTKAE